MMSFWIPSWLILCCLCAKLVNLGTPATSNGRQKAYKLALWDPPERPLTRLALTRPPEAPRGLAILGPSWPPWDDGERHGLLRSTTLFGLDVRLALCVLL